MTLSRRNFLQLSAGLCAAAALPSVYASELEEKLNVKLLTISLGLDVPFRALHISDTHITLADERENERKRTLAAGRKRLYPVEFSVRDRFGCPSRIFF